jgi:hypothetical protein
MLEHLIDLADDLEMPELDHGTANEKFAAILNAVETTYRRPLMLLCVRPKYARMVQNLRATLQHALTTTSPDEMDAGIDRVCDLLQRFKGSAPSE